MPPFRDDQILIIAPGSQTTLAQLGLPESFTPARWRVRSCMFPAEKEGEYEPVKIRRKEKGATQLPQQLPPPPTEAALSANGEVPPPSAEQPQPSAEIAAEESPEWEEDRISSAGAIWPLHNGRITDWPCFYALLTHVFNTVSPPFHTPILLISEPVWTAKEHEKVTQFFFEKFKTPAFALMDAAMAAIYACGVPTATVIDVGWGKADVSCVVEFLLQEVGRSVAVEGCGGEAMTERLGELLSGKGGFTREVCEQLKLSSICEVLHSEAEIPAKDTPVNPAAEASTGASGPGADRRPSASNIPRGPGPGTQVGEEKSLEDDEGVLDIAGIVTGGNMNDYLAKRDAEKAEKAALRQQQKKGSDAQQLAANKPARVLPNSKRPRNTFVYEDYALHDAMKTAGMSSEGMANMQSALDDSGTTKRARSSPEPQPAVSDKPAAAEAAVGNATTMTTTATTSVSGSSGPFRRELEVGPERFLAASGTLLDTLADTIHRTISSCPDLSKRAELWENLIILGNGSRLRGFKEALLANLERKYLISPSSATIFTSELPSNLSTPMGTGAQTPQPGHHPPSLPHHSSGVNPLLLAATTAQNPHLNPFPHPAMPTPGIQQQPQQHHSHHTSHAQSPTAIRQAKIPDYFPEWKEAGYEEAAFLGAQVAAKVLFISDSGGGVAGGGQGYLTRTGYNEQGPGGIHEVSL